ncbi:MAG: MarR family transcriptional regulator [bacterium]
MKTLHKMNILMLEVLNDIVKLEEVFLKKNKFNDISIKELRTIEAINTSTIRNMGNIAKKLGITVGTLTVCITNLEKKGYVRREKSLKDRRIVNIKLTEKSKIMLKSHRKFREDIMIDVLINLTNQEKEVLSNSLNSLREVLNVRYSNI